MGDFPLNDMALETDRPLMRQVQFDGKRLTISVEPTFWSILKEVCQDEKIRLNQLIRSIYLDQSRPDNLAASIRIYCARYLHRKASEFKKYSSNINLNRIMESCPVPCMMLSEAGIITGHNAPFHRLFGGGELEIKETPFSQHFKLFEQKEGVKRLIEIKNLNKARLSALSGVVSCTFPGAVFFRPSTICPVMTTAKQRVYLVFIKS